MSWNENDDRRIGKQPVTVYDNCKCVAVTDRAILVVDGSGAKRWVPKAAVHDDSDVYDAKDQEGALVVEEWFAEKIGLA